MSPEGPCIETQKWYPNSQILQLKDYAFWKKKNILQFTEGKPCDPPWPPGDINCVHGLPPCMRFARNLEPTLPSLPGCVPDGIGPLPNIFFCNRSFFSCKELQRRWSGFDQIGHQYSFAYWNSRMQPSWV